MANSTSTPPASNADLKAASPEKPAYQAPVGSTQKGVWKSRSGSAMPYVATAEWITLRKRDTPAAEVFHTYYRPEKAKQRRPVTFVFNGGPGASSAYLHVGALGPQRVYFEPDGNRAPPPARLVNNQESWLEFSDLVFVDPVGTGFSRVLDTDSTEKDKKDPKKTIDEKEFYQLNRDLDSLGEFIERFLSKHKLWEAPVYIAGESYGGFRTAKLARLLQEKHGVGLCAVFAISPALEWALLNFSDYDVLRTVDGFCTMALAAAFHGRSRVFKKNTPLESMRAKIESFAARELAQALVLGDSHPEAELKKVLSHAADFLGLEKDLVIRAKGRVPFWRFARELLKDSRRVVGCYDAAMTAIDPFPDRESHEAPDPTLAGIQHVYATGINQVLRSELKLDTDRRYELLSEEVNRAWKRDGQPHAFDLTVGATDDLRFAMSMNPEMKVFITHGYFDMVTPYFSSQRLIEQMKLTPEQRKNLFFKNFFGGHMFYTWEVSRREFRDWARPAYTQRMDAR
jgi:carboxypeptidase C (cathepsin A)